MKIRLKEPITLDTGVSYPTGFEFRCDCLVNVPTGHTYLEVFSGTFAGAISSTPVFFLGTQDFHKIEIVLELPAEA